MKSSEKHFRCTVCQRGFTRIDHLKRHQLRHTGLKPYSCIFCDESFARCDNLRDHYVDCDKRGDQKIPETGQRGRRRHACHYCTSMKLRCDGMSPCGSCQKKNIECNNGQKPLPQGREPGLQAYSPPESQTPGAESEAAPYEPPFDRGSIKFLLNGGTDSFTEQFHLPPNTERARGLEYHNQKGFEEAEKSILGGQPEYGPAISEYDPTTLSFFQDNFVGFLHGPFGDPQKALDGPYNTEMGYQAVLPPGQESNVTPERPFAMAMIQAILAKSWTVPLHARAQEEVSANLHFLLTTARIRRFVTLFSKFWQPNCPVIHVPSFNPETVTLQLLTAVVFMGSMYSDDPKESSAAKKVLDFAELFVFSSDTYALETEIGANLNADRPIDEADDLIQLQNVQAGFTMMVTQYWAGSRVSRNRAMESRFSDVVKVARRMALPKCRHLPQDQIDQSAWIRREERIRTMCGISLIDSAYSFFQNYPCRLAHCEIDFDLPCEESIFNSANPFAEPDFRISRGFTFSQAFQSLFDNPEETRQGNPMGLTVFDMFILIHILYAFINTQMTLLVPVLHKPGLSNSMQRSGHNRNNYSIIPDDSVLSVSCTALSRWREHWLALNSQVPVDKWASMGMYKNGYNFWLVSHLLVTKKKSLDVVMQMEVNCEDKLEKLKVLLNDR